MIPKKIHYCWFGKGAIPQKEINCMKSWGKLLPDFEVVLWDESRFDVNSTKFTKEAYKAKKYAFVSDYVRLLALKTEGGIYLDTDVEIIKPLHTFLKFEAFGGFETPNVLQTGVIGSVSNGVFINRIFDYYKNLSFVLPDGSLNQTPNSKIITEILLKKGLKLNNKRQSLQCVEIFPQEFFCPINQATQEIVTTQNTYCIHYLSGSWLPKKSRYFRKIKRIIGRVIGFKTIKLLRSLIIKK